MVTVSPFGIVRGSASAKDRPRLHHVLVICQPQMPWRAFAPSEGTRTPMLSRSQAELFIARGVTDVQALHVHRHGQRAG
jgi:hypothetical protein